MGLLVFQRSYSPTQDLFEMESMNYIAAPTWYFNQGNELCFQTSIPHHTNIIHDMLTVHPHMLVDCTREPSTLEPKRPASGRGAAAKATSDDEDHRCSKKRKIMHRDVERQRRKEMSTLHALLRSLLPDDFLKARNHVSFFNSSLTFFFFLFFLILKGLGSF